MKDTLRILVDWKCNLKCSYCCNEQEHSRSQFKPTNLNTIDFSKYSNVCISGGEPLMFLMRVSEICRRIRNNQLVILYTNGIFLSTEYAQLLEMMGVHAVNIGLHDPKSFKKIITNVLESTKDTKLSVRFHVWENYKDMNLEAEFPTAKFKYWTMDECDRDNEERVILTA